MKALCRLLKYPSRFAIIKAKKAGKFTPGLESIILIHHAKDFPAGNPHGTPPGQGGDKPGARKEEWVSYGTSILDCIGVVCP